MPFAHRCLSTVIICLLSIACCGRATWEIWGCRGVFNPLSFSMSPILPFIWLPVVVESVSQVTGPRPGNLCYCRTAPAPRMLSKTLSPTVIGFGRFYHRWIRINETNTVHVSDSRNSMAFIFHIEYMKLAKTVYRNIR